MSLCQNCTVLNTLNLSEIPITYDSETGKISVRIVLINTFSGYNFNFPTCSGGTYYLFVRASSTTPALSVTFSVMINKTSSNSILRAVSDFKQTRTHAPTAARRLAHATEELALVLSVGLAKTARLRLASSQQPSPPSVGITIEAFPSIRRLWLRDTTALVLTFRFLRN